MNVLVTFALLVLSLELALSVEVLQSLSDHVESDVREMNLSDEKLRLIFDAYGSPRIQRDELRADAALTHWNVTPHTMYRYLASGDWTGKYNGKSIVDAAYDTVQWRKSFGIHSIDVLKLLPLLERGVVYVNGADKHGSALLYFKIGNIQQRVEPDVMIRVLMYSVERADRYSTELGSGQFVAVIDLAGMTFSTAPSFEVIKTALGLLKHNYPYRLNSLIILNAGMLFTTLWSLIKPLMPARALAKSHVLNKKEAGTVLRERVGREQLEQQYGGEAAPITDFKKYIEEGYWYQPPASEDPAGEEDEL